MNAAGFRKLWPVLFKDVEGKWMGWLYEDDVVHAVTVAATPIPEDAHNENKGGTEANDNSKGI
jgi:hypothetical protein